MPGLPVRNRPGRKLGRLTDMRRILVTGAATWAGGRLIQQLEHRPDVEVLAVDEIEPRLEFASELHHFELDRPEFAHFILDTEPEVVVHLQTVDRSPQLGGSRAHEEAVVGAQALFGAIGRCDRIRHVVVKSDVTVYGVGPRNPSVASESSPFEGRRSRYVRDLAEMERYLEDLAARRPDVTFTILRFAGVFGEGVANPLSRYLRLPVVPTRLGFDPRLQLISEADAVGALAHSIDHPHPGAFNIAATGQMYLSRILRLGKRASQPLPKRLYEMSIRALGRFDLVLPSHVQRMVRYGLVADTDRMRRVLGFEPKLNLRQTILSGYGVIGDER